MPAPRQFSISSRLLHWAMAAMLLAMLGIGLAMVVSLADYHVLLAIHRPLGIAILVLAAVRLVNRALNPPPPWPPTVSRAERLVATVSEYTLYGLMFAIPLVGWAMLSAARYPVVLYGPLQLPHILPHDLRVFAALRQAHTVLAYLLLVLFLAHLGAVLFHTLIVRDGLLKRMVPWRVRPREAAAD